MSGVYISYPFCTQKCSFCNFASTVGSDGTRAQYARVLLAELRAHNWEWSPETVYFGGGTPSLMPIGELEDLMKAVPADRLREATLECAPGTVTSQKALHWRHYGINRVSLGVQSFESAELHQTGRRHTAETVQNDVQQLRAAGITNINIDLIAGLPEQTTDSWERSLNWIERLQPPHVSVYLFEIDEDSRLGKEILTGGSRYGAARVPSDDLAAELYERALLRLDDMDLERYEISNFARAGFQSRHNLKYWRLEPYMGFGLDAHSFDGQRRWSNPDNFADYFAQCETRKSLRDAATPVDTSEERFFVGLRLDEGIEPTLADWRRFARPIDKWVRAGMLEIKGSHLRLSERGVLLSNEIFQEFIDV